MRKFKLNSGFNIPSIGLGVFKLGEATYETVKTALNMGYRHIDTATIYKNEEAVGKAIKDSGINRDEIFITTKLWNEDQRKGTVNEAINTSLAKLDTNYVDLYLVHWPVKETYADIWLKMEDVLQAGKAKSIGVSNYQTYHLDDLLKTATVIPAVNQIEFNPYMSQHTVVNYCKNKNIHVQAWSPLGAGKVDLLSNPVISSIAQKHNKTTAQVILNWILTRGITVMPKSSNENRLRENFQADGFHLTDIDIEEINKLNKNLRTGADPDNFDF